MSFTLASSVEHDRRRHALKACGLDPDLAMTRGASYANEAWLGDEVVLRVNWRGVGRLAREARIAARVPREAKYPEILAVGDDDELEWMLTRRVPGVDLGRAWAGMSSALRERAIHELARALAAIHATPTDGIPDDIMPPHTLPLDDLLDLFDDVRDIGGDRFTLDAAEAFVRERWDAFDDADRGLVHGDPHLENVVWDGEHVSAVIDLEWSRPSWIHADLEILLAVADHPALFASAEYEHEVIARDYADVPRWLAAAQPAWFAHPRLVDRLEVLFVSRTLGHLIDGNSPIRWRHLQAILDGMSYLRRR
jgi:aminoglycoside phosphotransferase (APT) family kinase protein